MILFSVIGCPRLKTPEGTVVTYNDDVIKVSCNNSRESFTLKCVNNTWFGELRNCSIPGQCRVLHSSVLYFCTSISC